MPFLPTEYYITNQFGSGPGFNLTKVGLALLQILSPLLEEPQVMLSDM